LPFYVFIYSFKKMGFFFGFFFWFAS